MIAAALGGCSDPPTPPPLNVGSAAHVQWVGFDRNPTAPVVLVWDRPGGPLDPILGDADLTTFLNQRFTPIRLDPGPDPPRIELVDLDGCWRLPPWSPRSALEVVEAFNRAELDRAAGHPGIARPGLAPELLPGSASDHPLRRTCAEGGGP